MKDPFSAEAEAYYFARKNAAIKKAAKAAFEKELDFALNETFNYFQNKIIILQCDFLNICFECYGFEKKQIMNVLEPFLLNKGYYKLFNKNNKRGYYTFGKDRTIAFAKNCALQQKITHELKKLKNA